jgi:putative endopeptidase
MRLNSLLLACAAIAVCLRFTVPSTCCGSDAVPASGIDVVVDPSIAPGDNFFSYVNHNWLKNHPIPPQHSRWGVDVVLDDSITESLYSILTELSGGPEPTEAAFKKLRDFYTTALDQAAIDKQGIAPLQSELDRIAKIQSADDLLADAGHLRRLGIDALCSFGVSQDEKQSDRYAAHLSQGGMGLPERDYYLGADADSVRIREAYRTFLSKIFTLAGDSSQTAAENANTVLRLETKLAESSRSPTDLRDPESNYNKKSLDQLQALTPNIHWQHYFQALVGPSQPAPNFPYVIVGQPEFFTHEAELIAAAPMSDWRVYLRAQLLCQTAPYLSQPFETADFDFYHHNLAGVKEMDPRWKRVIVRINGDSDSQTHPLGEALGRLYVEKYFPPLAKTRATDMVHHILDSYRQRLQSRTWLSPETKKIALAKLAAITLKIGYPDHWRDYSSLQIARDSYVQNDFRVQKFELEFWLAKLNQPVDKSLWAMTPPTVNCYYDPQLNEIVFPAGVLQPPFFNYRADDAVNYGAIGSVIGHEITHGFDDQGSQYDAAGNLKDWWTTKDRASFTALTEKLVKQFDAYSPLKGVNINGKLTLGENIADLGGINISYFAYQNSLQGKPAPVLDNLTGQQRFFVGYAHSWCDTQTEEQLRLQLRTDPHSPEKYRVLGPLSNFTPFYEIFHLNSKNKMYRPPADRIEIW